MICPKNKKFSKSFKGKAIIAGSCAVSTLFIQVPAQAMLSSRIARSIVASGSRFVTGVGGASPRYGLAYNRNATSFPTPSGNGFRNLMDRYRSTSHSSGYVSNRTSTSSGIRGNINFRVTTSSSYGIRPSSNTNSSRTNSDGWSGPLQARMVFIDDTEDTQSTSSVSASLTGQDGWSGLLQARMIFIDDEDLTTSGSRNIVKNKVSFSESVRQITFDSENSPDNLGEESTKILNSD